MGIQRILELAWLEPGRRRREVRKPLEKGFSLPGADKLERPQKWLICSG
jgi:hypothetical protein